MSDYKIVGVANHQIMLEYDGIRRNFPLPIHDGLYPEGAELTALLDAYIAHQRETAVVAEPVAANEANILALVEQPTDVQLSKAIRIHRNQLLTRTDYTQLADSVLSDANKLAWAEYRATLKALPEQVGFPSNIVWPIPPFVITNPQGIALTNTDGSPTLPLNIRA